jgi:hypothetical protein
MSLRLRNRKRYPYCFLALSVLAFTLWAKFLPGHPPEVLLSGLATIAGFTYFLYRQHLDETRLFKELFVEFNARYDKLCEGLNTILFGQCNDRLSAKERDLLFGFFNLCAEEFFFYNIGYIDRHVWEAWSRGMSVFFQNERIRALWDAESKTSSYYGFQPPNVLG